MPGWTTPPIFTLNQVFTSAEAQIISDDLNQLKTWLGTNPQIQGAFVNTGSTNAGSFADITFPTAFRSGTIPIVVCTLYTVAGVTFQWAISVIDATHFRVNWAGNGTNVNVYFSYIAIGITP